MQKKNRKLIVMIRGGIGNQLFCYAIGRNLSLKYNQELVLDLESGFRLDSRYNRKTCLHNFCIHARSAVDSERMEPFGRIRRKFARYLTECGISGDLQYIKEPALEFSQAFLQDRNCRTTYLDGYWQSEKYFTENEKIIRDDLTFLNPDPGKENLAMLEKIKNCNAVMIHFRCFNAIKSSFSLNDNLISYYQSAIDYLQKKVQSPHFFIFSDNTAFAIKHLTNLIPGKHTIVSINSTENAIHDLWLQTHFRYFVIANSTFSWWGAWLSKMEDKIIIAPTVKINGIGSWGFDGLLPDEWVKL